MVRSDERERPTTTLGLDAFSATDWLLLAGIALAWGSSFVWIEIALEAFEPTAIALLRLILGAATLALFRKSRAPVDRSDLPAIALLGAMWMAMPFILFPVAQQWIDSSLAGMINGGVPIFAGFVSALLLRTWPPAKTVIGIAIGFLGVVAVSWPAAQDSSATFTGAALVLLATASYGVAINIAVPLQQRYGALPVLLRAQLVALMLVFVPGIFGLAGSEFDWASLGAMVPLGCFGTAIAFVWMTTLIGRTGAARGSVSIYFVPVVAIILGAALENETISPISLAGTALVLGGAFLASRNQMKRVRRP